jgi:hypothetical protein
MLLGTSHLAQTPGDTQNSFALDAGDVLDEQRQEELNILTDRLTEWDPDRVAVEEVPANQSDLNAAYTAYKNGQMDQVAELYDQRNEIVQVGFRLADKLGHESVAAVDYRQSLYELLTETERKELTPLSESLPKLLSEEYPLPAPGEVIKQEQRKLSEGSLLDHYRRLNTLDSEVTRLTEMLYYTYVFEQADVGTYTPVKLITAWYQRNFRIASNIWNVPAEDDKQVLVIFGSSHLPSLRTILNAAPMFAPVSPLQYLEA